MSNLKKQFKKVSENWLLVVLFVFLLIVFSGVGLFSSFATTTGARVATDMMHTEAGYSSVTYSARDSFAPEEEIRLIIKNAIVNLEVRKNNFFIAEQQIKSILTTADAFIISESVSETDKGLKRGRYTVRVDARKLDSVKIQLKETGDLKYFSESGSDVTGTHTDLTYELEVEKETLERYYKLYNDEKTSYDNKIDLISKISNQERRIKYLEDRLENLDERIAYSTININLTETSDYVDINFFKFSGLLKTLVNSINSLFFILFAILPYVVVIYLLVMAIRLFRKKPKKKR